MAAAKPSRYRPRTKQNAAFRAGAIRRVPQDGQAGILDNSITTPAQTAAEYAQNQVAAAGRVLHRPQYCINLLSESELSSTAYQGW